MENYQTGEPQVGLVENWITEIFIDDRDRVWIGTERRGLSMLSPDGKWTNYDVNQWGSQSNTEYYDKQITALTMDKKGRLWIGTWDALFVLDMSGNWMAYTKDNSGWTSPVKALTIDDDGRLWIASFRDLTILDLQSELPKTVSNEWVHKRELMYIPLKTTQKFLEWAFFPVYFFSTSSIFSLIYIAMILSVAPLALIIRKNIKDGNRFELKISIFLSILVALGIIFCWMITILFALIPT